jgi:hypothetical protein
MRSILRGIFLVCSLFVAAALSGCSGGPEDATDAELKEAEGAMDTLPAGDPSDPSALGGTGGEAPTE